MWPRGGSGKSTKDVARAFVARAAEAIIRSIGSILYAHWLGDSAGEVHNRGCGPRR